MTTPVRFAFAEAAVGRADGSTLAYVPITLRQGTRTLAATGLLDTGATINVLPYSLGLQLGFVWERLTVQMQLAGGLARSPARGVVVSGQIASFPPVDLVFAWARADVPLILGQMNFFMEFDVCFFRSQAAFEVRPRGT